MHESIKILLGGIGIAFSMGLLIFIFILFGEQGNIPNLLIKFLISMIIGTVWAIGMIIFLSIMGLIFK